MINFSIVVQFKNPYNPKWISCSMYCTSDENPESQVGFTVAIMSNIATIARKPDYPIIGIQVNTNNDDVFEAIKNIYKDKYVITRTGTVEISFPSSTEEIKSKDDFYAII